MKGALIKSKVYPSLIQGVSQQAKQLRRDGQCQAQTNCINSVVTGAEARYGGSVIARVAAGLDLRGSYCYRIRRGATEQYLVVVWDGDLKVFNLLTGAECTVTFPDGKGYLDIAPGLLGEDSFTAISIQDTTILANKRKVMAMGTTESDTRPPEAIFYWKAGAYKTHYTVSLEYASTVYAWRYETPDNSASGNAAFITTEQIAATFYRAMSGTVATSANTDGGIIGSPYAGHTGGLTTPSGSPTVGSLGFNIALDGSVIRLWRTDTAEFRLSVSDGQGGKQLIGFQDSIGAFTDLPASCFEGYIVKVAGEDKTVDDDYYVRYTGETGPGGAWLEVVKPGTVTGLDATTLPHLLRNTAPNTFVFEEATWGNRVAGDGVDTAKDPSFIGWTVQDLFYDRQRLGILTEANLVWSRAKQPFVFFPDSAQTTLATDNVDIEVNYKQIVLGRRFVATATTAMLWAEDVQFNIGTNDQTFKQETVEALPLSHYEFTNKVPPLPLGSLVFFAVDHGDFTSISDIIVERGAVRLDNITTAHVPRYLTGDVRWMAGSDTLKMLLVHGKASPRRVYLYQWLITDEGRVQAAWNHWNFPAGSEPIWFDFSGSTLYMLCHRPGGAVLEAHDLSLLGRDEGFPIRFRLDHKVNQDQVSGLTYNDANGRSSFTLPYDPTSATEIAVVLEADAFPDYRGRTYSVVNVIGSTVTVMGDLTDKDFSVGFKIDATRTFTEFFEKDQQGNILDVTAITLDRITVFHGISGYYRVQVETPAGTWRYDYEGRRYGDQSASIPGLAAAEGQFSAPIGGDSKDTTIRLINDSVYPSSWSAAEWFYQVTRAG